MLKGMLLFHRPASIDDCKNCHRHPSICTCYPLLAHSKCFKRRKPANKKSTRPRDRLASKIAQTGSALLKAR